MTLTSKYTLKSFLAASAAAFALSAGLVPAPSAFAGPAAACEESDGLECGSGSTTGASIATAIGISANAGGTRSVALGRNAEATDADGIALGSSAQATGPDSIAVGAFTDAFGEDSTAIGDSADAEAFRVTAIGADAQATGGTDATAVGYFANASGTFSVAVGSRSDATQAGAIAIGGDGDDGGLTGAQAIAINATAIGSDSSAGGGNSTAIGNAATVTQDNAMVLGSIPAINGATSFVDVGIGTNAPAAPLHIRRADGSAINMEQSNTSATWSLLHEAGTPGAFMLDHTDGGGADGAELTLEASGELIVGTLTVISDVNAKQGIELMNGQLVLEKLEQLQVSEWGYKADPQARHVGPMAQDFHAAFGLGNSTRHISPTDMAGVNMVAIKALVKENEGLKQELEEQNNRVSKLEAIVDSLISGGKLQLTAN